MTPGSRSMAATTVLPPIGRFAAEMPERLAGDGILAVEVGFGQATAAAENFRGRRSLIDGIERDLAGIERCVVARMGESGRAVASSRGQKNLGMCRRRV